MSTEKKVFIQQLLIALLRNADPTTPQKWGNMSFAHMVEHLILATKSANGKIKSEKIFTSEDRLPGYRQFLMSDKPFQENTKAPFLPEEVQPLHFKTVGEAIDKLEKEINDFFTLYENTADLTILNPAFGNLNYNEAEQLLYKHFTHHAKQFGLV